MNKPIRWEALMRLKLEEIADLFPNGAVSEGKDRWAPTPEGTKPTKTLTKLLRARRSLIEVPRLLPTNSTRPPVKDTYGALGATGHKAGPVDSVSDGPPPEPERVSAEWERENSRDARERHTTRKAAPRRAELEAERGSIRAQLAAREKVARERGLDIRSDIRVMEKRLEAIDRKLGIEKAA